MPLARPPTYARTNAHAEERKRSHLPLPAVSLFSANVAKCLHFCITAPIKPPPPPPLSPSWTSRSPALCSFLPSSVHLHETGPLVEGEKKTLLLYYLVQFLPSLLPSHLLPFPIFITTQAPSSAPLSSLYSTCILLDPLCSLLSSVSFSDFIFIQNFFAVLRPLAVLFFLLLSVPALSFSTLNLLSWLLRLL